MITLSRATKLLSDYVYEDKSCNVTDYDEATRLSIEALKETKRLRKFKAWFLRKLLPGETEEVT